MNNKQEAAQRLAELKEEINQLEEIINQPEKTKEDVFMDLIQGLEIKIDKGTYADSVFFFKDGVCFFELENSTLWCSYINVWSVFETEEFQMNYDEIQQFIKEQVEQYFKMKDVTPDNAPALITP